MSRNCLIILIIISLASDNYINAQDEGVYNLFPRFSNFYNSGDLINAEQCMKSVLDSEGAISEAYLVAAYNNLGATYTLLGRYQEALVYYNLAEAQTTEKQQITRPLGDIYINKAIIYGFQRKYNSAIEYFEKGIRIYLNIKNAELDIFNSLSTAYLNIGIIYYHINENATALEYLKKSAAIKEKYNLSKLSLTYLNIAKTYLKSGDQKKAEEFFTKSIKSFIDEFGNDYYRMAELYFDYGQFLDSAGRDTEALEIFQKALSICIKSYGEKNTLVSLSYKHLGDFYLNKKDYSSALIYYQKALVSIVNDFNDPDIHSNPSVQASLYDIRLLDILKSKSEAYELLANQQEVQVIQIQMMEKSFETIDLALQLINRMRNDYMTEESRLYLAENEKETYIHAIDISYHLHTLTGNPEDKTIMYNIARQAKAAILRSEITGNKLFYSIGIPDSLQQKRNSLLVSIEAYNNLIQNEMRNPGPDIKKTDLWKDALFEMKRDFEKLGNEINKQFPQYMDLLKKTEPMSFEEIRKNLKKGESLIEYFLSNRYVSGKRMLYIFTVTKNRLDFHRTILDSAFLENVEIIKEGTVQSQNPETSLDTYRKYTRALFNMYDKLIKPVEITFAGEKLIIIPDEEIAYLPFEAFLKSCPDSNQINYEGLEYLINKYTFSYGYSSSLIFGKQKKVTKTEKVYAFAPEYGNDHKNDGKYPDSLGGATSEIGSIFRWFSGRKYLGDQATETNFKSVIRLPVIIHLAMHSITDPDNSRYSFLLFDTINDSVEDGKIYDYEISINRINSPMVVLSACNTGSGTLSRGEGIMSLTRGFILAGASSAVKTFWDVNDDASAKIITDFYRNLSKGKTKDESLRLAKLAYLKTSPPAYVNPWYWAAYSVTGDRGPVAKSNKAGLIVVTGVLLIVVAVFLTFYFRRRKRSFALS